ncbi:MAG: DUF547 domain-containing protein [Alphaproteobacteria bacterium]|nr:DUF547 domain-containing protein [Alphaproteobacteria bacterium]
MIRARSLATLAVAAAVGACRPVMVPDVPVPDADPSDAWEQVLAEVVTEDGRVDYDLLTDERAALDAYVAWIGKPARDGGRGGLNHAMALNAYNALVMFAVLQDGRPDSVLDVPGLVPRPGFRFFYEQAFLVQGHPTSLWEIEHEMLRNKVMDERDHGALNCASASCPPLRPELYRSAGLDRQLKDQMQAWIADDRGVRFEGDQVLFSPIFDWFAWDWSLLTAGEDLCTALAKYARGDRRQRLTALARQGCPHGWFDYDWSLNDASGRGPGRAGPVTRRAHGGADALRDTDPAVDTD